MEKRIPPEMRSAPATTRTRCRPCRLIGQMGRDCGTGRWGPACAEEGAAEPWGKRQFDAAACWLDRGLSQSVVLSRGASDGGRFGESRGANRSQLGGRSLRPLQSKVRKFAKFRCYGSAGPSGEIAHLHNRRSCPSCREAGQSVHDVECRGRPSGTTETLCVAGPLINNHSPTLRQRAEMLPVTANRTPPGRKMRHCPGRDNRFNTVPASTTRYSPRKGLLGEVTPLSHLVPAPPSGGRER